MKTSNGTTENTVDHSSIGLKNLTIYQCSMRYECLNFDNKDVAVMLWSSMSQWLLRKALTE